MYICFQGIQFRLQPFKIYYYVNDILKHLKYNRHTEIIPYCQTISDRLFLSIEINPGGERERERCNTGKAVRTPGLRR